MLSQQLGKKIVKAQEELTSLKVTQQLADDSRVVHTKTIEIPRREWVRTPGVWTEDLVCIIIECESAFPLVSVEAKLAEWDTGGNKRYPTSPWGNGSFPNSSGTYNNDSLGVYSFYGNEIRQSDWVSQYSGVSNGGRIYRFDDPKLFFHLISVSGARVDRFEYSFEEVKIRSSLPFNVVTVVGRNIWG